MERRLQRLATAGVVALVLLFPGAGRATADLLTYTETATGSGSLGGINFTDALITITQTSDTSQVMHSGPFYYNLGTPLLTVAGVGSATFTDSVYVYDNQAGSYAGFTSGETESFVLATVNTSFATYDLNVPIGPILGPPMVGLGTPTPTSAGAFLFTPTDGSSFTATAVPEPACLTLALVGAATLAGGCLARRRRQTAPN